MKISLIVPTYKEDDNILELLTKIQSNLNKKNISYNVIIIDDSPTNNIKNLLKDFNNNINYFFRGKKLGRGSAVLDGIKIALKTEFVDMIIEMDADLSHDPKELNTNIEKFFENKCDLLVASRYKKESQIVGWPIMRKILSYFANKLAKLMLKIPVSDYTNGYRFYSKRSAELISKNCGNIGDGFIVLSEILLHIYSKNFKICESSTFFKNRTKGHSSVNFKLIINSIIGLIKLYLIKEKLKKIN